MDQKPKILLVDDPKKVWPRPKKRARTISMAQYSAGEATIGPRQGFSYSGEAVFSRTGNTFYLNGRTYHRVTGGHWSGGNFICAEDGNAYGVVETDPDFAKKSIEAIHRRVEKNIKRKEEAKKHRKKKKPKTCAGTCLDCKRFGLIRQPEGEIVCNSCGSANVKIEPYAVSSLW